jgi:hypothetical protein
MSDRLTLIQKHISDQSALERHILEAVKRQRDEDVVRADPEVNTLLIEIERTLESHLDAMNMLASSYDAKSESMLKKAITAVAGVAAGLYDQVRSEEVSRMLRDNYTALSLATMGYTAFTAFGLTIKEPRIADLAERHLKDLTPLLVSISEKLPTYVVHETVKENPEATVDATVGPEAVRRTQSAWTRDVTESLA